MSLHDFAERELDLLVARAVAEEESEPNPMAEEDVEMQKLIKKQILEIVDVFASHGHSGFSAGYAISVLTRLLNFKPLSPLTGEDDEWCQVCDDTKQNKRFTQVFLNKDPETSEWKAEWIEGRVFSDNGGKTWYSGKDSRVPVTFPFTVPDKPEYIILGG